MPPATRTTALLIRALALGALLAVAALALAGCGSDGDSGSVGLVGSGNTQAGSELFGPSCGSCHALAAAGTTGTVGPDLDDGFGRYRIDASGAEIDPATGEPLESALAALSDPDVVSTIRQVVRGQISYPVTTTSTGAPGMPGIDETLPICKTDQEPARDRCFADEDAQAQAADDIASYVASVAGIPGLAPAKPGGGATDGEGIFAEQGCGGCHTFSGAGSTGTVGPNLDETRPSLELAIDRITNGQGGMPPFKGKLTPEQIAAVAKYVAAG